MKFKTCKGCFRSKPLFCFHSTEKNDTGVIARCKKCISDSYKTKEYRLKINKLNKENREKRLEYNRRWRKKNKEKELKKQRIARLKLRVQVINHYGGKCQCCGEIELNFLTVDHVNRDGNKHRKQIGIGGGVLYGWLRKNNFPKGFRILCHNCNWGVHVENGVCPHKVNIKLKTKNGNSQVLLDLIEENQELRRQLRTFNNIKKYL